MFRIISQDKKYFVKLGDITVDKMKGYSNESSIEYVISSVTESFSYKIGIYPTEKRALEVLNKIEEAVVDYEKNKIQDTIYAFNHLCPIFEMPKE